MQPGPHTVRASRPRAPGQTRVRTHRAETVLTAEDSSLLRKAIENAEPVVLIDARGTRLAQALREAHVEDSQKRVVLGFHLNAPAKSVRLNILGRNPSVETLTAQLSVLATVLAQNGTQHFQGNVVGHVAEAMLFIEPKLTLKGMCRCMEQGPAGLVTRTLEAWLGRQTPQLSWDHSPAGRHEHQKMLVQLYESASRPDAREPTIDRLLVCYERHQVEMGRLLAHVVPIIIMLTAGEDGKILSPMEDEKEDTRPTTDLDTVREKGLFLYVGLASGFEDKLSALLEAMLLAWVENRHGHAIEVPPLRVLRVADKQVPQRQGL